MADPIALQHETYPWLGSRFLIYFGSENIPVESVEGLNVAYGKIEYRNGLGEHYVLLGLPEAVEVTVVMALRPKSSAWADWMSTVQGHAVDKKDIQISLTDMGGTLLVTWSLVNACPLSWTGPSLNASQNDVAKQTIKFVADYIDLKFHS